MTRTPRRYHAGVTPNSSILPLRVLQSSSRLRNRLPGGMDKALCGMSNDGVIPDWVRAEPDGAVSDGFDQVKLEDFPES